jgi:NAD+ synthase (glutamine-hydrolysing)
MKVAIAQINPTVGDIAGNVKKIIEFGRRALEHNAELVIFPEMAVCGYPPMDLLLMETFVQAALAGIDTIARELRDISVIVGCVDRNRGVGRPLHNACMLLQGGKLAAVQYKTLLPTYDVFDEDRYFEPAHSYSLMNVNGSHVAASICEDIWNDADISPVPRYLTDPISLIAEQHPDFLVNISASPYSLGKENVRHELVRHQALRHKMPVFYVNQVGGNDELIFDGRSIVVDSSGKLIASAAAWKEDLIIVDLEHNRGEIRETSADTTENVHDALVLGTRDYMAKCGFKKSVVGLSGGIDSAVVCALAARAVGAENVVGVSMPSPHSSDHSVRDARELAENLGIEYHVVPIQKPMTAFDDILSTVFAGTKSDTTEENIQARLRGMTLMAMSNKFGYLVLTTGNKSELAVGYCTLYGDMCGGLAVISDVPKMLVYDLARYINESASRYASKGVNSKREDSGLVIPLSTIEKPPSAELRPGQKDQDTLPAYVVLDGILHAYVEQRLSADEIVRLGYKPEVVMEVINRIDSNEYKRYQAAPGLKVTAQSFGFGWRMPIAQRFKERLNARDLLC